jgi:hypothetical protein
VQAFRGGQYANTSDGIVFILGYKENLYQAVRTDRDEEGEYFECELTPWSPQDGEQVTEVDNEDGPIGIIVEACEDISMVVWKGLRRQAPWANSCLEPVWSD